MRRALKNILAVSLALVSALGFGIMTASAAEQGAYAGLKTVRQAAAEQMEFQSEHVEVYLGDDAELSDYLEHDGNDEDLTWETSDSSVAVVDYSGALYTIGEGEAEIKAVSQATGASAAIDVSVSKRNVEPVFYLQGDSAWGLPRDVAKRACYATCFAMVMTNLGIEMTPKSLYEENGSITISPSLAERYGAQFVSALAWHSEYFKSFDGERTWLKDNSMAQEAVKEALAYHPEGVIVYFKRGDDAHGIVAVGVDAKGELIFMDPGTRRGENCSFEDTWVVRKGQGWNDFSYISTLMRK